MDAILALRDRRCDSPSSVPRSLLSSSRSESLLELEMAKSPVAEGAPFPPMRNEPEAGRCDPDFRCAPDDDRERFPPVPSASSALSEAARRLALKSRMRSSRPSSSESDDVVLSSGKSATRFGESDSLVVASSANESSRDRDVGCAGVGWPDRRIILGVPFAEDCREGRLWLDESDHRLTVTGGSEFGGNAVGAWTASAISPAPMS